ncbi:hypothetical protein OIO90_000842 [Microbotryomycetes sp. JL221]|nr:hypothetical protein OIO90_000842 [Microbotryomycetes sp. JL221]
MAFLSEPQFVLAENATTILSETRPLQLAPDALASLNFTLDELLQLWVHSSIVSTKSQDGHAPVVGPVYSTEQLKAGVLRVSGANLGNQAVIEAEVAVQELLKLTNATDTQYVGLDNTANDKQGDRLASADLAHELFVSLREWIHSVSGLGVAAPLNGRLSRLLPNAFAPEGTSSMVTFKVVVYAERCLTWFAEYLLRAIGRVAERGTSETANMIDVEAAFAEDELVWNIIKNMRVQHHVAAEAAAARAKLIKSSPSHHSGHSRSGSQGSMSNGLTANGTNSPSSSTLISVVGRERQSSFSSGLGIHGVQKKMTDDFETLVNSGQTRKLSLTPDRLRTVEKGLRSRPASMAVGGSTQLETTLANNRMSVAGIVNRAPSTTGRINEPPNEAQETLMDFVENEPAPSQPVPIKVNDDQRAPSSVAMRTQISQISEKSQASGVSTESEPEVAPNTSPKIRKPRIRAKDERKDLAHERQINHDLADFFATAPPPSVRKTSVSSSIFAAADAQQDTFTTSPKRKPAFGGLFSRKRKDSFGGHPNQLERLDSNASRQVPPSISGVSVRSRASSQDTSAMAAMKAAGFSDIVASRASYAPPPLLGLGPEYSTVTPTESITPTAATFAEKSRTPNNVPRPAPNLKSLAQSDTSPVSLPRRSSANKVPTSAPLPPSLGAEPTGVARTSSTHSRDSSFVSAPRQPGDRRSEARSSILKMSPRFADDDSSRATTGSHARPASAALAAGVGVGAVSAGAALAAALGSQSDSGPHSSNKSSSSPRVSSNGHPSPQFSNVADDQKSNSTAPSVRRRKIHERSLSYSSMHSHRSGKDRPGSVLASSEPDATNSLMPAATIVPASGTGSVATSAGPIIASSVSNKARTSLMDADMITMSLSDLIALRVRMATNASSVAECVALLETTFGLSTAEVIEPIDEENAVSNQILSSPKSARVGNEASMAEFYLGGGDERMSKLYGEQRLSLVSQKLGSDAVKQVQSAQELEEASLATGEPKDSTPQLDEEAQAPESSINDHATELAEPSVDPIEANGHSKEQE